MMFAYGGFTVAATHDYLSWNRVRWQALHHLMQEDQISLSHIGGGFEFNGWYLYDDDYDDWKYEPDKSWYWVDNDDYVVSVGGSPILRSWLTTSTTGTGISSTQE
jgi:hypothetical protein